LFLEATLGWLLFFLRKAVNLCLVQLAWVLFAGLAVLGQALQSGAQFGVSYAVGSCLDVLGSDAR
jgi:hypothetical protein